MVKVVDLFIELDYKVLRAYDSINLATESGNEKLLALHVDFPLSYTKTVFPDLPDSWEYSVVGTSCVRLLHADTYLTWDGCVTAEAAVPLVIGSLLHWLYKIEEDNKHVVFLLAGLLG